MKNFIQNTWRRCSLKANRAFLLVLAKIVRPINEDMADLYEGPIMELVLKMVEQQKFPPFSKEEFYANGAIMRNMVIECFKDGFEKGAGRKFHFIVPAEEPSAAPEECTVRWVLE